MAKNEKTQQQSFSGSVNSDVNPELIPVEKGIHLDAKNMRRSSAIGNAYAKEQIKGEQVLYATYLMPDLSTTLDLSALGYKSIGYTHCKGYQIAFWAHQTTTNLPLITIDGKVVCQSDLLGLLTDYPLQIDVNESCTGGEVFTTDFHISPYIFNVKDLLYNYDADTDVYFASFNPNLYTINLVRQNDQPVFDKLDDSVGAGNGLAYGMYAYAIQYVEAAGDNTAVGTFSPLIPVIFNFSTASENVNVPSGYGSWDFQNYPTLLTRGASGGNSKYGIKLNYRITNTGNYDHVNIIRIKWNEWIDGGSISPIPSAQYFEVQHSLSAGEISVRTFTDQKSVVWADMTPADETQVLSSIQCAKGIRYYDNKLILMNIKYASMDLSNVGITIPVVNSEKVFPYIHNMGVLGHADPKNTTYYKGFKGGEKYGFGILAKDNEGERTFVFPIDSDITGIPANANTVFNFPNNREVLSTNSKYASYFNGKGAVIAAVTDSYKNNHIDLTNEIISLNRDAEYDSQHNVCMPSHGAKYKSELDEFITIGNSGISGNDGGHPYYPIHPIFQDDNDERGHNRTVVTANATNASNHNTIGGEVSAENYIFQPEMFAKGLGITGVQNLPSWVKSFSIVRTKSVERVISQGIGAYALYQSGANLAKSLTKIFFYSQDVDAFLDLDDQILNAKQIQLVSPIGFSSEIYSAMCANDIVDDTQDIQGYAVNCHGIDMVSYARLIHNSASINATNAGLQAENLTDNNNYYTEYGAWRHAESTESNNPRYDITTGHVNGNKIIGITSVVKVTRGRYTFYEIELAEPIYKYNVNISSDATDTNAKKWHEPFYLVNIINDGATIPQEQMTTYYETGHQQKLESIIGSGTNSPITLPLCDERYDDCMPADYSQNRVETDTFIYIRDKNTGVEQRWLNVTYKIQSIKDQIIYDLNTNGVHVIASPYPNPYSSTQPIAIYGIYGSQWSDWTALSDTNGRDAKIVFNNNIYDSGGTQLLPQYCIPNANTYIIVKYDDRFPLKVFGGDTIVSEDTTCFIDGKIDENGQTMGNLGTDNSEFIFLCPFPYMGFKFSSLYKRCKKATAQYSNGFIEQLQSYRLEVVRQLAVNYFYETKIHMPYDFNDVAHYNDGYTKRRNFPRTHYIMRPENWVTGTGGGNWWKSGGGIDNQYFDSTSPYNPLLSYGDERENWGYGGFICNNILQPSNKLGAYDNQDYQSFNNYMPPVSKPAVGWKEIVNYCTRIIWSQQRNIAQQDVPNLKTFLSDCFYDIEDAYGEIKYAFSANTGSGENLYAFTNNGIAILLTQKIMTQDTTGNLIAYIRSTDAYITGRQWIRTDVGMNDEMWRSAVEWAKTIFWANNESAFMMFDNKVTDIGRLGYRKRLFYDGLQKVLPNYGSVVSAVYNRNNNEYWLNIEKRGKKIWLADRSNPNYVPYPSYFNYWYFAHSYTGNQFTNIANYLVNNGDWIDIQETDFSALYIMLPGDFTEGQTLMITNSSAQMFHVQYPTYSGSVETPVQVNDVNINETFTYQMQPADSNGNHAWLLIDNIPLHEMFVAYVDGDEIGWNGVYAHNFEKMLCLENDVYGIRDGKIYQTQIGYLINDVVLDSSVTGVCNAEVTNDKEFIAFLANTENKPTSVDFANSLVALPECTLSYNLPTPANSMYLKEYGQNRWFNKIPRKFLTNSNRSQGRILIFKITHTAAEDFVVISSVIEYKNLKLQL